MNGSSLFEWLSISLTAGAAYLAVFSLFRGELDSYYMVVRMNRYRRSGFRLAIMPILEQITRLHQKLLGTNNRYVLSLGAKIRRARLLNVYDADELLSIQIFNAAVSAVVLLLLFAFMPEQENTGTATYISLIAITVFTVAVKPVTSISALLERRKMETLKEWPFFMDLLTLAMEGGMDIITATRQILSSAGTTTALFEELREMLNEIELGMSRTDAMQKLCERIDSDAITSVINLMIQAETLGMPIAPLMRAQAKDFRERRVLRVEKLAQEAPVKMMGPLMGCIFPAILLIMVGPLLLQYMAAQ